MCGATAEFSAAVMIYRPCQLECVAQTPADKVDEFFLTMLKYHIDEQAIYEVTPSPSFAAMLPSRNYWDALKAGFEFTKPTPCFKKIAVQSGVSLDDEMTCYAIAAVKVINLQLDEFMKCIAVNAFSEQNLFNHPTMYAPFWSDSMFLYHMSESNAVEWHDLMGAEIPLCGAKRDENRLLTQNLNQKLEIVLKQAFDDYIDAWAEWLRHYANKTDDIAGSLGAMTDNFIYNVALTPKFNVRPEDGQNADVEVHSLFEKAMRITPSQLA